MSARCIAIAAAFLLSIIAPVTAFAAIVHYEFHAVDPVIELASGDAVLVDLLRSSAAKANLHGRFSYEFDGDDSTRGSIVEFSGSAWGVSFDFPQIWLALYPASRYGGTRDAIFVGPGNTYPNGDSAIGEYTLFLAGLQYFQDAPWIPDNGDRKPEDLSLLVGTPGLLEMCFSNPDNSYGCLFIHGVETTEVPLPAGGGLLLSAFAGLAALRRRSLHA